MKAAVKLGRLEVSNEEIVQALMTTAELDTDKRIRREAVDSLLRPTHQAIIQQHLDWQAKVSDFQKKMDLEAESEARQLTVANIKGLVTKFIWGAVIIAVLVGFGYAWNWANREEIFYWHRGQYKNRSVALWNSYDDVKISRTAHEALVKCGFEDSFVKQMLQASSRKYLSVSVDQSASIVLIELEEPGMFEVIVGCTP